MQKPKCLNNPKDYTGIREKKSGNAGLGQDSPWEKLQGQILERMERLAEANQWPTFRTDSSPRARPSAEVVTAAVLSGYRIKDENTLYSRAHQEAFQGWVYLLRRTTNLPLQEVATRAKVLPSRISKIQRD